MLGEAESSEFSRSISSDDVRRIASKGYPLWESIEAMQLRNRRITIAYDDLSVRLANLISGSDERRDANWCTFSTWSTRSVGSWINSDAAPEPREIRGVPGRVMRWLLSGAQWLAERGNAASFRCLAAANRFVFLEVGYAIAVFMERFGTVDRQWVNEEAWTAYWHEIQRQVAQLSQLDPSWLLTDPPELADLELGLRQYYEALFATDPDEKSELILAGNLLICGYEQRRSDGYIAAALALFTRRALRNLIQHRSGVVSGWLRRPASAVFTRLMTKGLVLNFPDEQVRVGRPLPPPSIPPGSPLFPSQLDEISLPILQALITRYDRTDGKPWQNRVRDWTSYDERMSYIANLFRSRQHNPSLFSRPFPPEAEQIILDGRFPPDGPVPAGEPAPEIEISVYAETDDEDVMRSISRSAELLAAELGYGESVGSRVG